MPTPSTLTSIPSPATTGPTPLGVPVAIRSPGKSVITWEMKRTMTSIPKMKSRVLPCCPGINFICNQWANWTEGIEAFCAGPLIVFVLQVTRGEIIYARITEDVRTNILFGRNFVAWLTDHDPEFSFVVRALRNSWPTNTASWGKKG